MINFITINLFFANDAEIQKNIDILEKRLTKMNDFSKEIYNINQYNFENIHLNDFLYYKCSLIKIMYGYFLSFKIKNWNDYSKEIFDKNNLKDFIEKIQFFGLLFNKTGQGISKCYPSLHNKLKFNGVIEFIYNIGINDDNIENKYNKIIEYLNSIINESKEKFIDEIPLLILFFNIIIFMHLIPDSKKIKKDEIIKDSYIGSINFILLNLFNSLEIDIYNNVFNQNEINNIIKNIKNEERELLKEIKDKFKKIDILCEKLYEQNEDIRKLKKINKRKLREELNNNKKSQKINKKKLKEKLNNNQESQKINKLNNNQDNQQFEEEKNNKKVKK